MSRSHTLARSTRLAGTLVVVALAVCGCSDSKGTSVVEVPFTAADGSTASVADFRGQPLVLNMWATNCRPCVKEMPAFDKVAGEYAGTLQIIGVNVFDNAPDAAAFAADLGVTYPQFTDPDGALSTALSVTGLPATAFFDESGKLVDVHQGAFTADELRAAIAQRFPSITSEGTTP
ncbi:MAG: TlpA disulfide reductase family protein [Ilumatobacteraceae bacterium]